MEAEVKDQPSDRPLIAEVIAIGDELSSGQRLDTNSQWLSQQLGDLGVVVRYHSTVVDEIDPMEQVIGVASRRANVIVLTGGLGPTADDLTRDVVARVANVELEFDQATLDKIRHRYEQRGRAMPENNRRQAWFPAGCRIIPNPRGTAPGIDMPLPDVHGRPARLFALPGVPAEMKPMWQESVVPAIARMNPGSATIVYRSIQCFGAGESDIEMMLPGPGPAGPVAHGRHHSQHRHDHFADRGPGPHHGTMPTADSTGGNTDSGNARRPRVR